MTYERPSHPDTFHVWIERFRRELGRPSMTDDAFERLGHDAALTAGQLPLDAPESPRIPATAADGLDYPYGV